MPLRTEETPDQISVFFNDVHELTRTDSVAVCERAIETGKLLVADLEDASFINSLMIGAVVMLHKEAKNRQVSIKIVNISPDVLKILMMSRLDRILQLETPESDVEQ